MSTEEKITSNSKTVEQPKPKRRFKLDKKHIQGFIAGILLCVIAFTGLYYGTDGQFFSGTLYFNLPIVTDANFEKEVLMSDRIVLAVVYIRDGTDGWEDRETDEKNIEVAGVLQSMHSYHDRL